MKALSIKQPWAWLIVNGFKDIENRNWKSNNPGQRFRGEVLIHSGLVEDTPRCREVFHNIHPMTGLRFSFWDGNANTPEFHKGGIVGRAVVTDIVTESDSPWFAGPHGLVITDARPLPFIPCKGMLGFFNVPEEVAEQVREAAA